MPVTGSGLTALCAALLLFPSGGVAETLHSFDRKESSLLVRRESVDAQISRNQEGVKEAPQLSGSGRNPGLAEKDYLVGKEKNKTCRFPANETLVNEMSACKYAAERTGAHLEPDHIFRIESSPNPDWVKLHPHGCFHVKCTPYDQADTSDAAKKDCFFYNNGDERMSDPSEPNFTGTPICQRDLYKDGATDGQDGCPSEYQVIRNETLCNEMCSIKNLHCAELFRIGIDNFTEHWDYPSGCFHLQNSGGSTINGSHSNDRVFMNALTTTGTAPVLGTVMCHVASPLHWSTNAPTLNSGNSHVDPTAVTAAAPSAA